MRIKDIVFCICFLNAGVLFAQTPNRYHPYSFFFLQKLDKRIYDVKCGFHSSMKPVFTDDSLLSGGADSLFNTGVDTSRRSWFGRKLFNEHLLEVKGDNFTVYADFLPDFQIGYASQPGTTWLNTRGYQLGGTIGKKISFYANGFENQAVLPGYLADFSVKNGIIPGQNIENNDFEGLSVSEKDWAYSSAVLSYTPVKYVNLVLGHDKNFIGDGYRSMLLSDLSANYPFFKTTFQLGNVKYMAMWALMQDLKSPKLSYEHGYRKKWGVFHYADWNVNERLSLGFFESVIWQDADSTGKRGFDLSYVSPLAFLRPVEKQNGSPDNSMLGITAKYELFKNAAVYGQFMLDEFVASEFFSANGDWRNKWGMQLGVRGFDAFRIKNLHYLFEYNTARPYTYSHRASILNYGHYNQPLAHPFGANFREFLTIWQYSYKRFNLAGQINSAQYGLDESGKNYGKDIYRSYDDERVKDTNNSIVQGTKTDFLYIDGRVSYLLNPKTNLRLELGGIIRNEQNAFSDNSTKWLTFGLRSSFRNIYLDL